MSAPAASANTARLTSGVAVAAIARNAPVRSPALYFLRSHVSSPDAAHSRTRGKASGAITVTRASAVSRLSIFDSAMLPAPTTTQWRPASFRKIGKRLIRLPLTRRHTPRRRIAFDSFDDRSRQLRAQLFVAGASEIRAQILARLPRRKIAAQQPLDRFGAIF